MINVKVILIWSKTTSKFIKLQKQESDKKFIIGKFHDKYVPT